MSIDTPPMPPSGEQPTKTTETLEEEALRRAKEMSTGTDKRYTDLVAELDGERRKELRAVNDIKIAEEGLASAVEGPIKDSLKSQQEDAQRRAEGAAERIKNFEAQIAELNS